MRCPLFSTCKLMRAAVAMAILVAFPGSLMAARAEGGDANVIRACVSPSGAVRILGPTDACRTAENPIQWNVTGPPGPAGPAGDRVAFTCPPDSVRSGTICMDKYEASVWKVPPTQTTLIGKIQGGTVKLTDLTSADALEEGVVHLGLAPGDLAAAGCPDTGNGCVDFYSVSISGVTPSAFVTWFQAAATARNSLKRLPTNQEWQVAALGTPDDNLCNVDAYSLTVTNTGSLPGCVSNVGAFDMVGNLYEWVADWVPRSTTCVPSLFGTGDQNCLAGASTESGPGALLRGGGIFDNGPLAGVFAMDGSVIPSFADGQIGFRAAR